MANSDRRDCIERFVASKIALHRHYSPARGSRGSARPAAGVRATFDAQTFNTFEMSARVVGRARSSPSGGVSHLRNLWSAGSLRRHVRHGYHVTSTRLIRERFWHGGHSHRVGRGSLPAKTATSLRRRNANSRERSCSGSFRSQTHILITTVHSLDLSDGLGICVRRRRLDLHDGQDGV
jgi:hypothetical protein